ncbi:RNA-guided endonuclease TnpB family protein [Pantoea sp. 18069]|uniref:RNA-guided endonuclease InsQ/TnpB family protein n=1 Tax=Pantoea sp. 18069 TaxID=2681415 RepID=UPI001359BA34|nr:RNA-guided endonuclease TnpB family protein [Pantoea sp. 18069]
MQIGHRFRCYPTPAQAQTLLQWIGCQRFIYNAKVGEDRYFRRFARKSLAHTGQFAPVDQQYSHFKTELTPWLSEVPSQILRNGAVLWKQAYSRYFRKLGGRPTIHKKHGRQAVWLTSELFAFKPVVDRATGEITGHQLCIGTRKHPVGVLAFKAHRACQPPASLHISIHAGQWHVSFNGDDGLMEPSDKETTAWLRQFDAPELLAMTLGLDRGVTLPLAGSDGQQFVFLPIQVKRLAAQEKHRKRWQKRQARRTQGSSNWVKARRKVARYQRYGADVRRELAHQTSHVLATDTRYKLFVFEALKIKNMTQKAKPQQDAQGRWLRNGAAAKSGLNKTILASAWGQTKVFLQYKARRQGKLVIEVPAFYSSQECGACGHIHQGNRVSQSVFVCQGCGHTAHADHNAATVIAGRGVRQLLAGKSAEKERKTCRIARQKVGAEGSEPGVEMRPTLGETGVSRWGGNTPAHWSWTQETPAITPV